MPDTIIVSDLKVNFKPKEKIYNEKGLAKLILKKLSHLSRKEFVATICLDTKSRYIDTVLNGYGSKHCTLADTQTLLTAALLNSADRIIIIHNHGVARPTFSRHDYHVLKTLAWGCWYTGLLLDDFVITGMNDDGNLAAISAVGQGKTWKGQICRKTK